MKYCNKTQLAEMFGISTTTVWRKVKGIEALIGDRYNRYAILDNLISAAVFADYMKYGKMLEDRRLKDLVPAFDEIEAGAYIMERR